MKRYYKLLDEWLFLQFPSELEKGDIIKIKERGVDYLFVEIVHLERKEDRNINLGLLYPLPIKQFEKHNFQRLSKDEVILDRL